MIEVKHSIFDFNPKEWNNCVPDNHPFLKFEFYQALEESKCIGSEIGWLPFFLAQYEDSKLIAILPIFLKSHSYGEYIFDWSWAQAYEKYGLSYYPKLTSALPHTPVSAPKFITKEAINIAPFIETVAKLSKDYKCSSTHFLFTTEDENKQLCAHNFMPRSSLQYHFQNNELETFDDYLASLRKDKRKNFKKERKSVNDSAIQINEKMGKEITTADAKFMAQVYLSTIEKKWSQAYLNTLFFERWFELLKNQMLFIEAQIDHKPIAAAIHLYSDQTLYGRYWGAIEEIPYLHFELCYYRAIEFAIKHKLKTVEAGAQGEHKLIRGFKPVLINSNHKIENPAFGRAISDFLTKESEQVLRLKEQMESQLLPFKRS